MHERLVEKRDDTQHLLIIFVISQCLRVGLEERDIILFREFLRELVDIDRLVVRWDLLIDEVLLRHEALDEVVLVDRDAGAVHPALELVDDGHVRMRILQDLLEDGVLEDKVALDEERVVLDELVGGERQGVDVVGLVVDRVVDIVDPHTLPFPADMLPELRTLVSRHQDGAPEPQLRELSEHAVDEPHPVDLHHALGVVLGQLLEPLPHTRR